MESLKIYGVDEGQGKDHEEVIYTLALLYNLIDARVSTYLKTFRLSPGKFNILMAVKHQGGEDGISQVEVSQRLIVTPSNMSKLLDKLEADGLVTRLPLAGDRRVHILKITPQGSRLLDEIWPGYTAVLKDLCASLDHPKQKMLAGLLLEWFNALR